MEQVRNEQTIYSAAVYCRLSKDDEQAGESVSIGRQVTVLCPELKDTPPSPVFLKSRGLR